MSVINETYRKPRGIVLPVLVLIILTIVHVKAPAIDHREYLQENSRKWSDEQGNFLTFGKIPYVDSRIETIGLVGENSKNVENDLYEVRGTEKSRRVPIMRIRLIMLGNESRRKRFKRNIARASDEQMINGNNAIGEGVATVSTTIERIETESVDQRIQEPTKKNRKSSKASKKSKLTRTSEKKITGKKNLLSISTGENQDLNDFTLERERTKRDLDSRGIVASTRNDTDYYAQRRAVMDRFYSRQREIAQKYGKQSSSRNEVSAATSVPRSNYRPNHKRLNISFEENDYQKSFARGQYDERFARDFTTTPSSLKFNLNFNSLESSATLLPSSDSFPPNWLNVYRKTLSCANATLSGTFAPKVSNKMTVNCNHSGGRGDGGDGGPGDDADENSIASPPPVDGDRWGTCKGRLLYQHNLVLTVNHTLEVEISFDVRIDAPVCISCVDQRPRDNTRATLFSKAGGPGYNYASFKYRSHGNVKFSYTIKVYGYDRQGERCPTYVFK